MAEAIDGGKTRLGVGQITKKVKSKHVDEENTIYLDCGYDIVYTKIREIFDLSQTQHFQSMVIEFGRYQFRVSWLSILDYGYSSTP